MNGILLNIKQEPIHTLDNINNLKKIMFNARSEMQQNTSYLLCLYTMF